MSQKGKHPHHKSESWADSLLDQLTPSLEGPFFKLSLLIPTYNSFATIDATLASVERQKYPNLEVILIDAGSVDKTLEVASKYQNLITRVYSVADYNLYEMINRGISLATGEYITILLPGSTYLSSIATLSIAEGIRVHKNPEIFYCGTIQRGFRRSSLIVRYPFSRDLLERGITPALLVACWFRKDLFEKIGKFNKEYPIRGVFEFLCRFSVINQGRALSYNRIYVDFDLGTSSYARFVQYVLETWKILLDHFGIWKALRWFLGINQLRIVRYWIRALKFRLQKR